ncbi:Zinc finger, FYVE/PHD-type [Trema orientale]|uniref:Zinc finger, FYVE/PHD-type n=1 Tax=Trema orientale TaxID=63057 RepID=A0A2P5BL55_TREOI|nr:Zinc finger, FYVE/PHD-type [Trema orientale]
MQGPSPDAHHNDSRNNMVSSSLSQNKSTQHSMSHQVHMRGESGACNVCAAPCSSCMHFNRSLMASKMDEFSDETCRVNVATQYSVNVGDASSSFKTKPCDSLHQTRTTSETSNLMSVTYSHDSLSENADSKAALRPSDDALDIELPPLSSATATGELGISPKPVSASHPRGSANKFEDSKVVEAHDDDVSCVSRANDAHVAVTNSSRNTDRKNLTCSSASVRSLGSEESRKRRESKLSEMPSSKDADASSSSPKVQSPYPLGALSKEAAAVDDVSCQKSVAQTDVPTKVLPKLEAEISNDGQESTDKNLKCSGQGERDDKSSECDEREPPSMSGDESDESDIVEHDVKVCDICGDAGREDMLAICSRCSDGAEHTYCMRKMLRKVPGSNWMCEECKFAEEINSRKQEVEGKRISKASLSAQVSSKRLAENIEVAPAAKRQALETSLGSPKSSSPNRVVALSRDCSFKNLDRERLRPVQQTSSGKQSASDVLEIARSPVSGPRLQMHKGTLFKSNSFNASNSKPKVRLVDEVVPEKQKAGKEHVYLDTKERSGRLIGKSMSFKSANPGRFDSKVKMLSPRFAQAVDLKGLKQAKERTAFERRSLSKLDRPLVSSTTSSTVSTPKADQASRVESSLLSFANNNRDSKTYDIDLYLKIVVGVSSASGVCNSATEQKPNPNISKDETLSSCSLTTDKPSNSVDGTMQDGLARSQEITHQTEKIKESSVRPRLTVLTSSRSTFCQKCKEIGHSAEFCTIGSSQASGVDSSGPRSSREETRKGSKLKDALHAALLRKPEIHRRKRVDQFDDFSTSITDLNSEVAYQDQAVVLNKSKNTISPEGMREMPPAILGSSTTDSVHTAVSKMMHHAVPTIDSEFSIKVEDSEAVVPSVVRSTAHAQATSPQLLKMPTIPEYEYIWQGCFEVQRSGSSVDLCGGIQAHLSTCASPRVHEVACKFPSKLFLSEVPRLSAWPTQFYDGGAKDDNIALYFFAKDLESYERNYKGLLDGMIKNDLALKGNLDGVELLIFPSNQLPENSQRWNMLFFLWGVFRARRVHCSDSSKLHVPNYSMMSVDKYAPNAVMTLSDNLCSPMCVDEEFYRSSSAGLASNASDQACTGFSGDCNDEKISEPICLGVKADAILRDSRGDFKCTSNVSMHGKRERSPPENGLGTGRKPSVAVTGANSSKIDEKMQLQCDTSVDGKDFSSSKIFPSSNEDEGLRGLVCEEKFLDGRVGATVSIGDYRASDGTNRGGDQYKPEMELKGDDGYMNGEVALRRDLSSKGVECCPSTERKRPFIDLSDRTPPASNGASQNIPWNGVNNMLVDGENFGKRRRTGPIDMYGCSSLNCRDSPGGGVTSKPKDLGPCLSAEEKRCVEACDEKVITEDLGTTERRFFPVDPRQGNSSVPWKSLAAGVDDNRTHDGFPNLELALGAETKPQNKGIMPLFVGLVDKKNNPDKPPDKAVDVKEDDVSSSLSLSLSFPFPDKEQPVKPVSKSEQLRPDRHHVNTSLLLFGGFSEK